MCGPCSMPSGLRRRRLVSFASLLTCPLRPGARRRRPACRSRRGRRARSGQQQRSAAARSGRARRRPRLRVPHPARRALGHHAAAARGARLPGADLCAARGRSGTGQVSGGLLPTDARHHTLCRPLRLWPEALCRLQSMRGVPESGDSAALAQPGRQEDTAAPSRRPSRRIVPHSAHRRRPPRARASPRRAWA
jgi:hypothetical protein